MRLDALLVSVNDRLAGRPGADIEPLTHEWLSDLANLSLLDYEKQKNRPPEGEGPIGD